MTTRIGINGFGRIGRLTFRALHRNHRDKLEVVAVNDLADTMTNAHLLKWDSVYGRFPGTIEAQDDCFCVDNRTIKVLSLQDPCDIPWSDYGVDIVIESTGFFTDAREAADHRRGSVKKVIISAPATNEDITVVMGVNHGAYDPSLHHVISNASCTTNGIAPAVKVLQENFGVTKGLMTTIHSYTNDQVVLDKVHRDIRRARAAGLNMIPTTTGAAKAVTRVIPELEGKIHGLAFRVPTPTVSVIDFVANLEQDVTEEEVNVAYREAAAGTLAGILEFCEEELVSMDYKGNSHSSIIDGPSTMVIGGDMVKILAWYDNEWGYSNRLGDLAVYIAGKGL